MKKDRATHRVYFMKPIGMDGPIKIGCSAAPPARLIALSVWSPYPLELIGSVPGTSRQENYLHRCFADVHSHREWFHSTPKLRAVIKRIVESGRIDGAADVLEPKGPVRKTARIVRLPEHVRFLELKGDVRTAERLLRAKNERGAWRQPADVENIVKRWSAQVYQGGGWKPTDQERARIEDYLADPAAHSVIPSWLFHGPQRSRAAS
jgi:hypothetical protein